MSLIIFVELQSFAGDINATGTAAAAAVSKRGVQAEYIAWRERVTASSRVVYRPQLVRVTT